MKEQWVGRGEGVWENLEEGGDYDQDTLYGFLKELIKIVKKNKSDSSGPGFITSILLEKKYNKFYTQS